MSTLTLNSGVEMPALGLGVFQTPPDETRTAVESALSTGYRHVDTAAEYGNEREVGESVRSSGLARDEVFVETKIWISDYGYDATLHGFEKSAAKLGLDQIDLLILHQALPSAFEKTREAYRSRCIPTSSSARSRRSGPSTASRPRRGRRSAASRSTATGPTAARWRTR
jgi:diketogulonate reductase-like aldo/keto reductase